MPAGRAGRAGGAPRQHATRIDGAESRVRLTAVTAGRVRDANVRAEPCVREAAGERGAGLAANGALAQQVARLATGLRHAGGAVAVTDRCRPLTRKPGRERPSRTGVRPSAVRGTGVVHAPACSPSAIMRCFDGRHSAPPAFRTTVGSDAPVGVYGVEAGETSGEGLVANSRRAADGGTTA